MSQYELHAKEIRPLGEPDELAEMYTGAPVPSNAETRIAVREREEVAEAVVENDPLPAVSTTAAPVSLAADPYTGAGSMPFPPNVQAVLKHYHNVPDEWIDIRPEGHIYLSYTHANDIMDQAFGHGGWSMVPVGDQFQVVRQEKTDRSGRKYEHVTLYREYRLYCLGQFVRQAMGAGDYRTNNPAMNLSDAAEMCESYAMNRCAKRFRIASQCWDRAYAEQWKKKYAVETPDGWKKKNAAARPTAEPEARNENPTPRERQTATTERTETSGSGNKKDAVIAPRGFGKVWAIAGYVIDDDNQKWTFPKNLLPIAETAIQNGNRLRVQYETKGTYRNVLKADLA